MSHPVCSVAEENSTEETDRRPTLVSSARYSGINCLGFIWEVLGDLNRFRFTGERSTTKSHARLEDSWGEWWLRLVKKPLVEEAITVKVHHRDPALGVYNKVPSIWEEAALWHQHAWLPAEDAYCLLQTRLLTEVEDNSAKCHKTGAALCRWTMSQNRLIWLNQPPDFSLRKAACIQQEGNWEIRTQVDRNTALWFWYVRVQIIFAVTVCLSW